MMKIQKNKRAEIKLPVGPSKEKLMELSKEEAIDALFSHIRKIERINAKIEAENRKIISELVEVINRYQAKLEQYELVKYNKYVGTSEKIETVIVNEVEVENDKEEKVKKERKKPTEQFIKELEKIVSETRIEDYDFESNGVDREKVKEFGADESIKIEVEELPIKVVKTVRPKYKDKDKIYQAISKDVFSHSVLTPSFASSLIVHKYQLSVPLNRYSEMLKASGVVIPANNLSNYITRAGEKLKPIYERIKEVIRETEILHVDETTIDVLDVREKENCYMFVYRTSAWESIQASLYVFNEDRKTEKTKELLKGKEGYVVCDGYTGFDKLVEEGIKIQRCWVHIRRYFFDCIKTLTKNERKTSKAGEVVELINKVFKKEKMFKENCVVAEDIEKVRNGEEYQKLLNKIDEKIMELDKDTKINANLRKAINYYLNIKEKGELYTFLENGKIEIDNNIAERTVKPITIGRKNYLFCKTISGAEVTALMYTIVQTALNNVVSPEKYIKYVLEKIDGIDTTNEEDIEKIMPWSKEIKEKYGLTKI